MVMRTKCICVLKGSWGSRSIVSIGSQLGGNGGGFPAREDVFVDCLP
jgi:hypothetical protein